MLIKKFKDIVKDIREICEGKTSAGNKLNNKSVGMGWTDKTLTRIENIQESLRNIGSGQIALGWTDKTLTRIENIQDTLRNVGSGYLKGSGWTDKTLTRIENIQEVLRNI